MANRPIEVNYTPDDGLTVTLRPEAVSLIPEPASKHFKAANKELLLALRSFVDKAIEMMEPEEETGRRPQRVRVKNADEDSSQA